MMRSSIRELGDHIDSGVVDTHGGTFPLAELELFDLDVASTGGGMSAGASGPGGCTVGPTGVVGAGSACAVASSTIASTVSGPCAHLHLVLKLRHL